MRTRKLRLLSLEDRLAPAVGDLLHNLTPPASASQFGHALAMNAQYVAVGASNDHTGVGFSGAVHLYDPATGGFLRSIPNPTPDSQDDFGESVALSGNLLAVGAPRDDDATGTDTGVAYLFDASTGALLWTLSNPSPNPGANPSEDYGGAVAIAGNIVYVGASLDATDGLYGGSVFRFDATTGQSLGRLTNPEAGGGDSFGKSLSVFGDVLAVGTPTGDMAGLPSANSGSVHLYTASTGAFLRSIANPASDAGDEFGTAVALSGNNLVVGAHYDDFGANAAGRAYVFNASTGALIRTLNNPTPGDTDWFGRGVAIAGDTVIVGAPYDDVTDSDCGVAYVFDAISGTQLDVINNPVAAANSAFGWAVAAFGARLAAGGYFAGQGNAHIFEGRPLGPPDAVSDSPSLPEDSVSYHILVLDNDNSPSGDLRVTGVTQGTHGHVTISVDGLAVEYTPDPNYNGSDSFTYTVTDGGGSDTANVDVAITPVNDDPNAVHDEMTIDAGADATPIPVLDNDSFDPDIGETLTISQVTQGSHGAVAITGGGTGLTYEPDTGYTGADAFTYTISDGNGGAATAIVAISIQNPSGNNPPDAVDDTANLVEDGGAQTIFVLANDSTDPDVGETLNVSTVTQGQFGVVAIAADKRSITYTPAANFAGRDSFLYAVNDGRGGIDYAAVNVVVANDVADRLEVVTNPLTLEFTEGNVQKTVDDGLRVSAVHQGITKALIKIVNGYVKGRDFLVIPATKGLKATFSAATGTLTLTGTPLKLNPEAILRDVSFKNTSPAPVAGIRSISFTLADSAGMGEPAYRRIEVAEINTAPTVTLTDVPLTFKENAKPIAVASKIKATDLDNTIFAGATVTISNHFVAGQDVLDITPKIGISKSYNPATGVLTLTGAARIAVYVATLKTVKYSNTSDGPSTLPRTLSFAVTDGTNSSNAATRIVNVTVVNDAPILDGSGNPTLPNVNASDTDPAGSTVANLLGASVSDPDAGAVSGIAIIGFSGVGNGAWEFSLNDGDSWQAVAGTSFTKGLLLRATDRIRFVPAVGFTGQLSISYYAWDQTTGAAGQLATLGTRGGISAFSIALETATVNVV